MCSSGPVLGPLLVVLSLCSSDPVLSLLLVVLSLCSSGPVLSLLLLVLSLCSSGPVLGLLLLMLSLCSSGPVLGLLLLMLSLCSSGPRIRVVEKACWVYVYKAIVDFALLVLFSDDCICHLIIGCTWVSLGITCYFWVMDCFMLVIKKHDCVGGGG